MGLEDGEDKFDKTVKYRSTLQNYLIDMGDEVILVDTGMPLEQPDMAVDVNAPIYLGSRIDDYVTALEKLGYKKEQVTKILVTHMSHQSSILRKRQPTVRNISRNNVKRPMNWAGVW